MEKFDIKNKPVKRKIIYRSKTWLLGWNYFANGYRCASVNIYDWRKSLGIICLSINFWWGQFSIDYRAR